MQIFLHCFNYQLFIYFLCLQYREQKSCFKKRTFFETPSVFSKTLYLIAIHKLTHNKSCIRQSLPTYTHMYKPGERFLI